MDLKFFFFFHQHESVASKDVFAAQRRTRPLKIICVFVCDCTSIFRAAILTVKSPLTPRTHHYVPAACWDVDNEGLLAPDYNSYMSVSSHQILPFCQPLPLHIKARLTYPTRIRSRFQHLIRRNERINWQESIWADWFTSNDITV